MALSTHRESNDPECATPAVKLGLGFIVQFKGPPFLTWGMASKRGIGIWDLPPVKQLSITIHGSCLFYDLYGLS